MDDQAAGRRKRRRRSAHTTGTPVWKSSRPTLTQCTEKQFLNDLVDFMAERLDRKYDSDNFPDAILNGRKLDLFNLYREVVRRGGYGCAWACDDAEACRHLLVAWGLLSLAYCQHVRDSVSGGEPACHTLPNDSMRSLLDEIAVLWHAFAAS